MLNCILNKKSAKQLVNGFKYKVLLLAIGRKYNYSHKIVDAVASIIDYLNDEKKKNVQNGTFKPQMIYYPVDFYTKKQSILKKFVSDLSEDTTLLINKHKVSIHDIIHLLVKNSLFKTNEIIKKHTCTLANLLAKEPSSVLSNKDLKTLKTSCPEIFNFEEKSVKSNTPKSKKNKRKSLRRRSTVRSVKSNRSYNANNSENNNATTFSGFGSNLNNTSNKNKVIYGFDNESNTNV